MCLNLDSEQDLSPKCILQNDLRTCLKASNDPLLMPIRYVWSSDVNRVFTFRSARFEAVAMA